MNINKPSIDEHWSQIVEIMRESNIGIKDNKKDFLQEAEILNRNKERKIIEQRQVDELAGSIFEGVRDLQSLKEAMEHNLSEINAVIKKLSQVKKDSQQPLSEEDLDNAFERSGDFEVSTGGLRLAILEKIKEVIKGKGGEHFTKDQIEDKSKDLLKLTDQLSAYSRRLELKYHNIERDLIEEMKIKSQGSDIEGINNKNLVFFNPSLHRNFGDGIEENFRRGAIILLNPEGENLPSFNESSSLIHYLANHIDTIADRLGVNKNGQTFIQLKKQIENARDLMNKNPEDTKFKTEILRNTMLNVINTLSQDNSQDAINLRLFFLSSGSVVSNAYSGKIKTLITAPIDHSKNVEITSELLLINMKVDEKKKLNVSIIEEFDIKNFAKGTKLTSTAELKAGNQQNEAEIQFSVDIIGDIEDPELHEVAHTIELAKVPLNIRDREEIEDNRRAREILKTIPPSEDFSFEPQSVQVLQGGNNTNYIGSIGSDKLVNTARMSFLNMCDDIDPDKLSYPSEPHITLVPPSPNIKLKLENGEALNSGEMLDGKKLELKFDTIVLTNRGNVTINAEESQNEFNKISKMLTDKLQEKISEGDIKPNTREPHMVIGKLSEEETKKILENPEKYGFDAVEYGVRKKLSTPLSVEIQFNSEIPLEQQSLQLQAEGGGISEEERLLSTDKFKIRKREVEEQQKLIQQEGDKYRYPDAKGELKPVQFSPRLLNLAIKGTENVRVPLVFSHIRGGLKLWKQFNQEAMAIFDKYGIKDGEIQILGSSVHGFSRNPKKNLKPWSSESDSDLAIFSKDLVQMCINNKVAPNKNIKLNGKLTVFKNAVDENIHKDGYIGFHDTAIGKEFFDLGARWSLILYGEEAPPDNVEFKMNIGTNPFKEAISLKKFE